MSDDLGGILKYGGAHDAGFKELHVACLIIEENHWDHDGSQEEIAVYNIFKGKIHYFAHVVRS